MHDLLIDNARIIDGLGHPAREGGVAVAGGRIAAMGRDPGAARSGSTRRAWCSLPASWTSTRTTTPLEALVAWRPALGAPSEARYRQLLADPSVRQALKHEMGQPGVPNRISNDNWAHLTVMEVKKPALRHLEGRIIGQTAREQKREPWDVFLDLGLEDDLDTMFDCRLFNTDKRKVSELLRHPCAAVALSDAGAHLSFLCDAGFGLHLFGHWVRERGDLTLPQAVRAVTSTVANAYRIPDRGRIARGAWADLMLFEPATVGRGQKRLVNELPTGASRLDTPAVDLHGVWVNGVRTADAAGVIVDCGRPGRVLKEFGA